MSGGGSPFSLLESRAYDLATQVVVLRFRSELFWYDDIKSVDEPARVGVEANLLKAAADAAAGAAAAAAERPPPPPVVGRLRDLAAAAEGYWPAYRRAWSDPARAARL